MDYPEDKRVNPVRVLLLVALDFLREGSSPSAEQAISDARAVTAYPGELKAKALYHYDQASGATEEARLQSAIRCQRKLIRAY
jgi:hypothetical protein